MLDIPSNILGPLMLIHFGEDCLVLCVALSITALHLFKDLDKKLNVCLIFFFPWTSPDFCESQRIALTLWKRTPSHGRKTTWLHRNSWKFKCFLYWYYRSVYNLTVFLNPVTSFDSSAHQLHIPFVMLFEEELVSERQCQARTSALCKSSAFSLHV